MDESTGDILVSVYRKHYLVWLKMTACKTKLSCYLVALAVEAAFSMKAQHRHMSVEALLYVLDCDGQTLCGQDIIEAKHTFQRL